MKKREYIEMLMQDIATETDKNKRLYSDVIDCVDIALSGEPDDFELDGKISVRELYKDIENQARTEKLQCVGPFEVAEMFAKKFGASYKRITAVIREEYSRMINLEDFI